MKDRERGREEEEKQRETAEKIERGRKEKKQTEVWFFLVRLVKRGGKTNLSVFDWCRASTEDAEL